LTPTAQRTSSPTAPTVSPLRPLRRDPLDPEIAEDDLWRQMADRRKKQMAEEQAEADRQAARKR
jgi:hypothetical protein